MHVRSTARVLLRIGKPVHDTVEIVPSKTAQKGDHSKTSYHVLPT